MPRGLRHGLPGSGDPRVDLRLEHDWLAERRCALDEGLRRLAAAARGSSPRSFGAAIAILRMLSCATVATPRHPRDPQAAPPQAARMLDAVIAGPSLHGRDATERDRALRASLSAPGSQPESEGRTSRPRRPGRTLPPPASASRPWPETPTRTPPTTERRRVASAGFLQSTPGGSHDPRGRDQPARLRSRVDCTHMVCTWYRCLISRGGFCVYHEPTFAGAESGRAARPAAPSRAPVLRGGKGR